MLAIVIALLVSIDADRGSTTFDLMEDDGTFYWFDVEHLTQRVYTLGSCADGYWWIREVSLGAPGYSAFPGDDTRTFDANRDNPIRFTASNRRLGGGTCPYGVERRPSSGFRFLGNSDRPWVAWNDSVWFRDTVSQGYREMTELKVRWLWSAYDSTRPWVRWTDTLDEASGSGAPLLTLTKAIRIDSIVPVAAPPGTGARRIGLQIQFDSSRFESMSYDGGPSTTAPAGVFPAGTNFRLDTRVRSSSSTPFLCRIWSGGSVMDSVIVRPAPPSSVSPRLYRPRTVTTGRSFDAEGRTLSPATGTSIAPIFRIPAHRGPRD